MGVFFEITAPNGKKSYLFGTWHSSEPEVVILPLEVKTAFEKASRCVFEIDCPAKPEEFTEWVALVTTWKDKQKHFFKTPIAQNFLKNVKADILKKNVFQSMLVQLEDIVPLSLALDNWKARQTNPPQYQMNLRLDDLLQQQARSIGKPCFALETEVIQACARYGLTLNYLEQIECYNTLEENHSVLDISSRIMQVYLNDDLDEIDKIKRTIPLFENAPAAVKKYDEEFWAKRDLSMASSLVPHLMEGNAFIALGAGHLKGIIGHLNCNGYQLTPIPLSQRCYPISELVANLPSNSASIESKTETTVVPTLRPGYIKFFDVARTPQQLLELTRGETTSLMCLSSNHE